MSDEALARLATGECYVEAVRVLVEAKGKNEQAFVMLDLPVNMLAGFALELLLKGYLLIRGRSPNQVKAYGHKVDNLYEEATIEGLPTIQGLSDLVDTLGEGHSDFTYRYIENGGLTDVFNWDKVLPIFDRLTHAIAGELQIYKASKSPA